MARAVTQTLQSADTIVAPATAPGAAAIAIVRMSGPRAHEIATRLFRAKVEGEAVWGMMRHGNALAEAGETLDDAMIVMWKGPRSSTGEDVAEFHLHGSQAIVEAVVGACIAGGCRAANPGEFTRRAFLNGRLDLAQAEAVADLSRAQTDAARRTALAQLAGGLSRRIREIRECVIGVAAQLEALVDFPEDIDEAPLRPRLARDLDGALDAAQLLIDSARRGRRLQMGARVVFAGPPNAGKSSLFNAMVGRDRALVSPHPGTTRDTIEASVEIAGIPAMFIDTAGLRERPEEIERLGIERTRGEIATSDLVLFVVDAHAGLDAARAEYETIRSEPHFILLNKADLGIVAESAIAFQSAATPPGPSGPGSKPGAPTVIAVSSITREGLDALESALSTHFGGAASGDIVVTSARHETALRNAAEQLARAQETLASSMSPEFIVVHLTAAISALDLIAPTATSQGIDEDVLNVIFSRFCLGK